MMHIKVVYVTILVLPSPSRTQTHTQNMRILNEKVLIGLKEDATSNNNQMKNLFNKNLFSCGCCYRAPKKFNETNKIGRQICIPCQTPCVYFLFSACLHNFIICFFFSVAVVSGYCFVFRRTNTFRRKFNSLTFIRFAVHISWRNTIRCYLKFRFLYCC